MTAVLTALLIFASSTPAPGITAPTSAAPVAPAPGITAPTSAAPVAPAPGITPLSSADAAQLATASDDSPLLDEAALYALLRNVAQWPAPGITTTAPTPIDPSATAQPPAAVSADEPASAPPPDFSALLSHPADARGQLFLIQGRFARARRLPLSRPGPWGDALTEWVLLLRRDPDEVAVVYFVDPDAKLTAPALATEVQTLARFYKVWADTDLHGHPARYLTFVARAPGITNPVSAPNPAPAIPAARWMLLVVALLAVLFLFLRRLAAARAKTRASRRTVAR
jgi:hypothetical protein